MFSNSEAPAKTEEKTDEKTDEKSVDKQEANGDAKPVETTDKEGKSKEEEDEDNLIKSTHTVQVKLADQQADPHSPLFSAKTFEELGLYVSC
jgi:hypothetical protein